MMGGVREPNGPTESSNDISILERKPIITYAGDKILFSSLEQLLIQGIPQEATEWRRSYSRPIKSVFTEATFTPFLIDCVPKEGDWHLIHQPIFHTYWTECADIDTYKTSLREDIDSWLKVLQKHGIEDWLIVQVETYDMKRSNKLLPRTTVLDKIRSDFASKHPDRCISVINPIRSESKSAETWRGLLSRIRILLLQAFDTTIVRFEETIRKQRERRADPGWSFCNYFLLQEELAFVLEMLGLYDDALVQYDELDALFTQFVLNSCVEGAPKWLSFFQKPLETWHGLQLTHKVNQDHRTLLQNSKSSLLQFRSYLFTRQCAMLLLTFQPWEIARRTLPFLHNCVAELRILEVVCCPGSVACWIFLACLGVLRTCDKFNDSGQVQKYSRFTASLWAYASEKLNELGELCGLLPGMKPTSEQLHLMVVLSAGMGDDTTSGSQNPTDQLKEALSSSEAFKNHYMEFSELAMGTYKHIGRVRLARVVGRNLASFHQRLGDFQKASLFLDAALQMLEAEGWKRLAVETRQELAKCYQHTGDKEKLVKTCAALSSSEELGVDKRILYFNQMTDVLQDITSDSLLLIQLGEAFELQSIEVLTENDSLVLGGTVKVAVKLKCFFPCSVQCKRIALTMEQFNTNNNKVDGSPLERRDTQSPSSDPASSNPGRCCLVESQPVDPLLSRISLFQWFDYQQDQSLKIAWASSNKSHSFLRRASSRNYQEMPNNQQLKESNAVSAEDVMIDPGCNSVILQAKVMESGQVKFGHMFITLCAGNMEFVSPPLRPLTGFEVISEPASISLINAVSDLLAGIEQEVVLSISSGSQWIQKGSKIFLKTSNGLQVKMKSASDDSFLEEIEVILPEQEPFQTTKYCLCMFATLESQKDTAVLEHQVQIEAPWCEEVEPVILQFHPIFCTTFRLHTSHRRKFAQVSVTGLSRVMFRVEEPELITSQEEESSVRLTALNPCGGQSMDIGCGLNVCLLWELNIGDEEDPHPIEAIFSMLYGPVDQGDSCKRRYQCIFDISDYKTLLVASAKVEPPKGSEFCRASTMCHLHLCVERVSQSLHNSLMYEVLVDQNMWAVCGRTIGVVTLEDNPKQSVLLDVMPLISGYLPVPLVRFSKYIPADHKPVSKTATLQPRREPFSPGQVFNNSKALQIHVLPSVPPGDSP